MNRRQNNLRYQNHICIIKRLILAYNKKIGPKNQVK